MKNLTATSPTTRADSVVRSLTDTGMGGVASKNKTLLVAGVIVLAGIGSGFWLANRAGGGNAGSLLKSSGSNEKEAGVENKQFKDEAEGLLQANDGSVTTEGTYQLVREGGPSQTAYLTSSVVDLTKFEGKKVKVKGETFKGQNAGWFMDVGWIKVME